jgi:outer membrane protein OmpA-like peptidoglycan-associated protein
MVAYFFGLEEDMPHKAMIIQRLTRLLTNHYKEGRRALLIVDEAQDLSASALEELRLLTNLQLNSQPLLQIFLLGQEELKDLVHGPGMEQVHQRLVAAYDLEALKENETKQYIKHRLDQAGWKGDPAISEAVFPIIYKFSHGIPRRINLFCSRLFLHGSVEEKHKLGVNDARIVIDELQLENLTPLTDLSDFDFNVPDKYEKIAQESIDSSIATETPAPGMQQPPHSHHNEQPGSRADIGKKDIPPKSTAKRKSGAGKQQKNTNKEQALKRPVSKERGKTENPENHHDMSGSISGQQEKPHVVQKDKQTAPTELTAEIAALKIELDGLSNNVHTLLSEKKELELPADKDDTSAKPRKKIVTLALLFAISLVLIATVLLATSPKTLDAEIESAGIWLDGISERVHTLFTGRKELEQHTGEDNKKPVSTSPFSETHSTSESEGGALQLKQEDQVVQKEIVEEDTFHKAPTADPEGTKSILPRGEKLPDVEEIHSTAEASVEADVVEEVAQGSTSLKQSRDVEPANDQMRTDSITATSIEKVEKDESPAEPEKIAEQSSADYGVQEEEYTPDNTAEKEKEIKEDRPVKKLFFQFNSADIQSDYFTELNEIAGLLEASPKTSALIIGYSDKIGNEEYNLGLSKKRAHKVASYLASQGISTDRLLTDGRGIYPDEPGPESNTEKIVPVMSRMVEIYFTPPINR